MLGEADFALVILAGGQSRRMGTLDKAEFVLSGKRLIDHVVDRAQQATNAEIILSAPKPYNTGLTFVPDYPAFAVNNPNISPQARPRGPVAGIMSMAHYLSRERPGLKGFVCLPVDAPLFPDDLITRLTADPNPKIVKSPFGFQPTFSYWDIATLLSVINQPGQTSLKALSLKALAQLCQARPVIYEDDSLFANINTLADAMHIIQQMDDQNPALEVP